MPLPLNKPLRILLATNGMILLAGAMLGPIYALFVDDIGGSLLDASIAAGVFALAAGLTTLVSGRISDRAVHQEHVIVVGYLVLAIGFLLYFFVHSLLFLLAAEIIIGIGEAIYSPAFDAVYSEHLDAKHEGSQWGAWESMNYFITALASFLGGIIVTTLGFHTLFICMAILSLASAGYILHLKQNVL